ncbi:MAG TPA: four-helix bundle copper-binding protein [Methylocystis sp.]|nr:four-helix bundle copper-binding protein [Methylocystis sp.]
MERREFIAAMGAAAAAASITPAFAEEEAKVHHHPPLFKALADAAGKCVVDGDSCLRHCFGMLSMNDTSMAACTTASFDTIAACRALSTLASVNSSHVAAFAKAVEQVCLECKKECDKFPQYSECVAMGASCKACAEECRKIAA